MITKYAYNKDKFVKNIYFTSSARRAFRFLLENLNLTQENKILLPAYIGITEREGSGVFDPVQALKIGYEFYALKKNLAIDVHDFEEKIKTHKFNIALIIHYFGFLHCDIIKIQTICKKHNVLLLEDCAHTLSSKFQDKYLGEYGDFSFFSVHKILPTFNGGFLQINNKNFNFPMIAERDDRISFETLELLYKSKFAQIDSIKINNYMYMLNLLRTNKYIEVLYPDLEVGIVPMNFPIIIKNNLREKVYFKLLEEDIPTIALYYRLIEQIDRSVYPDLYYVSNNILNLSIHQDITQDDIDFLVKRLNYHLEYLTCDDTQ